MTLKEQLRSLSLKKYTAEAIGNPQPYLSRYRRREMKENKLVPAAVDLAADLASNVQLSVAKKWFRSKTLWINVISFVCVAIQTQTGFVVDPAVQAAVLTLVNVVLRLVTKQGLA